MPATSSKFVFALLFALNCLLWSQSRYGHIPQSESLESEANLVKRISWELLQPGASERDLNFSRKECSPKTIPVDLQCGHVDRHCPVSQTFLSIRYLRHYFCTSLPLRPAVFVGLIVWLIFLFSTLGISAADFFTPNLATIAQLLGLDENVAGVTFLAFGNGSPDVFSTFSAMRADSGSLAIGELLGAASFIVSCVVGSMCIIKPFKVNSGPFLRDVGFFTVAVSMLLLILWDGRIRLWETAIMIVLYIVYVTFVVIGSWWEQRRRRIRDMEALARAEYQDDDELPTDFSEPYRDDAPPPSSQTIFLSPTPTLYRGRAISAPALPSIQTDVPPRSTRTPSPQPSIPHIPSRMPSFSLVGALEFRQVVASLRHQSAASSLSIFDSPYAEGHYRFRPRSRSRTATCDSDPWTPASGNAGVPLHERSPLNQEQRALIAESVSDGPESNVDHLGDLHAMPHSMSSSVPSITRTPASPTLSEGDSENHYIPQTRWDRFLYALDRTRHTLCPSLHNFRQQSVLGQIASIFAAPAITMLTLTLPVVVTPYESPQRHREKLVNGDQSLIDFEEEGVERVLVAEEEVLEEMHSATFNKWLLAAQCVFGPLFCAGVLFSNNKHLAWILLATGVSGIAVGVLVAVFANKGGSPSFRTARCFMGFLVAIVWIMAIADEVVNVLQTFGFVFGLSDAIIGLTIFAIGNSLADLVANMSVAVFAPIMGFSACFGGPMLNILLGVGISGSYIISQTSQPYELQYGTTLFVSTIGLLFLLAATLFFVPLNGYFLSRKWGIFLIFSYTALMATNVVVELKA